MNKVDEMGTTTNQAAELLQNLQDEGFEGNPVKLSIALGITLDETIAFLNGDEEIGSDLLLKIRGIAQERNIEIDEK